jgi:hypothetical protein
MTRSAISEGADIAIENLLRYFTKRQLMVR